MIIIPNTVDEVADYDIPGERQGKKKHNVENYGQESSGIGQRCIAEVLVPFGKYWKTRIIMTQKKYIP